MVVTYIFLVTSGGWRLELSDSETVRPLLVNLQLKASLVCKPLLACSHRFFSCAMPSKSSESDRYVSKVFT